MAGLLVLLGRHVVENREDYDFLATLDWPLLLPIACLSLLRLLIEALRFSATATAQGRPLGLYHALAYLTIGRILNKVVPQSGLAYKARMLYRQERAQIADIVSILGAMAWLQVLFTLLAAILAVGLGDARLAIAGVPLLPVLVLLTVLQLSWTAIAAVLVRRGGKRLASTAATRPSVATAAAALRDLLALCRKPGLLAVSAATVAGTILVSILRVMVAFAMLGESPGFAVAAVFVAVNRLATIVTITPGNVGVTELAYASLAGGLGIGAAEGIAVALIVRLVAFIVLLILGAVIGLNKPALLTG